MWPHRIRFLLNAVLVLVILSGVPPLFAQSATPGHTEGGGGPIVESAEAIRVTGIIQCWCGGCTNQTLHDCTCGLAATERQKVAAALAAGQTPQGLIAAYVAEHGPQVRIVPEKRGLNLIGWAIPFVASLMGLAILLVTLMTWRRRDIANQASATTAAPAGSATDRIYRERLDKDLREFDA